MIIKYAWWKKCFFLLLIIVLFMVQVFVPMSLIVRMIVCIVTGLLFAPAYDQFSQSRTLDKRMTKYINSNNGHI